MAKHVSRQISTIRDILREQTDATHQQLHSHSAFVDLFNGDLHLEQYRQLIQRFYGFYAPLDQSIERVIAQNPDTASRYTYVPRSAFLALDVADLMTKDVALRDLPCCQKAGPLVTPATLGGVLYVIEGATLGATQIDRAAQKLLGGHGPEGRRFWSWCRAQKNRRWKTANAYLDQLASQGVATEDMARGAQGTFDILSEWLDPLDRSSRAFRRIDT